ncbi:hypothetical protein I7I53_09823 [Histoplasma capsulatum var. duboisii H88]|uniref:Uncharacterized protein n=1 Tax=Ajellomyces capsulatus (strain H88) TaxID=544711 RepID=A0A8A1LCH6_AJEC8|nr:hypothetical protein I7I53_09823 [Histoplasma capsulatum var. duboisii H88]
MFGLFLGPPSCFFLSRKDFSLLCSFSLFCFFSSLTCSAPIHILFKFQVSQSFGIFPSAGSPMTVSYHH